MTKYRGPWNAASLRHRQTPRVYKKVGQVGDYLEVNALQSEASEHACGGCGFHICSCKATHANCRCIECRVAPSQKFGGMSEAGLNTLLKAVDEMVSFDPFLALLAAGGEATVPCAELDPAYLDRVEQKIQEDERLMFDGAPLRVGDMLTDRVPPKSPGLAARVFRVTELDGGNVVMALLNLSDGSRYKEPPSCYWAIEDVREELNRQQQCSAKSAGGKPCGGWIRLTGNRMRCFYCGEPPESFRTDGVGTRVTPTPDSKSMGDSRTHEEDGKNHTDSVMFEGRELVDGDGILIHSGPLYSTRHTVSSVHGKHVNLLGSTGTYRSFPIEWLELYAKRADS